MLKFKVGGRDCLLARPKKPLPGNPWVWRTEFFGAFDFADRALLQRGWHIAYHSVSNMYGCPESVEMLKEFYDFVTEEYSLGKKPALFGFSRGGLYAVNFALKHPDCCGMLYLDAPVLDIRSWPLGLGVGLGSEECRQECMKWYGLTAETAKDFNENPLDHAEDIAKSKIPVLLVCGGADRVVPYSENGAPFYDRVLSAGGTVKRILKPYCDHHPHSLSNPSPIVEYIEDIYGFAHTAIPFSEACRGMKAVAYGDSITYGVYTAVGGSAPETQVEKRWCDIVAERLCFSSLVNYSVSKIAISSTTYVLPEEAIASCYTNMDDDADIVFISAGTNDFGRCVALGTPEDREDISFYGALDVLCSGLLHKYPKSKIIFVTPISRFNRKYNELGLMLDYYREAIIDVAKNRYDFTVIDGPMLSLTVDGEDAFFEHMYDGLHPDDEAHRIYADGVIRALDKLTIR